MQNETILETINKACLKFQIPLSLDETYSTIIHEAMKLVKGDDGFIVRETDGTLQTVYGSSPASATYKVRNNGNSRKSLTENRAIIMHHDEIERTDKASYKEGIRSVIFIPMSYKENTEGVLIIRSYKEKYFTKQEEDILLLFGSFASLAIKKNELYEETKQALEVRDMFISLASHELRTPLTSINGYIQLLHSKMGSQDTSEAKWIRELYEESKRMTNLVQELLEINRIKQGQLQFILRESHFSDIVQHAIDHCKKNFPERVVTFTNTITADRDMVIGDAEKLEHVVAALIENAMKFSPKESEITIKLRTQTQQIHLIVKDQGSGIAREDMAKIFDGFYKGPDNHKEGMGVGLLLAKHIINYHKGSLSVQSEVKKGTTVEVKLPLQKV